MLTRAAIRLALRRRPPIKASWFDDDPPNPNHYFIYLRDRNGDRCYIVQEMDYGGVDGLWFEHSRQQEGQQRRLVNSELAKFRAECRHYYRGYTFTYSSPFWLFFALATLYPQRFVPRDKLAQRVFNRRPLVRADRMSLLRFFVDKTLKLPGFGTSVIGLMQMMYTNRFVLHPASNETEEHYTLLLDSLVSSGDLQKDGIRYVLDHHALSTLHEYEEQEQRHGDMVRQQRILGFLTFALVVVGLIQAVIALWGQSGKPTPP